MLDLFKWFKKGNKNEKKMPTLSESTVEELNGHFSPMEFEWIKGEFASTRESFKFISEDGENKFLIFQSGKRINIDLLEEFMIYFPAPPKQETTPSQQIPRTPQSGKNSSVTAIVYDDPVQGLSEDSPIYKLLKKQKRNPVEVGIKLKLNLPSKELYSVLSSSFDDAEREIIDFVLDGVDIEDIKRALGDSIKKNYYALNSNTEKTQTIKTVSQTKKSLERKDGQTA
jgi:hypothetical protein